MELPGKTSAERPASRAGLRRGQDPLADREEHRARARREVLGHCRERRRNSHHFGVALY